jgi:hypothetical protein
MCTCGHADDHEEGDNLVHHFDYFLCDNVNVPIF